jgi:tetratricopeptide (TPR) repeat protein
VVDSGLSTSELTDRLSASVRSGMRVAVAGAKWVWPESLDGVQPGDTRLVYVAFPKGARARSPLEVTVDGRQRFSFRALPTERPLLERAVAEAEIARLTRQREELPASKEAERARLADRIVNISTRLRVLSDFTALLVLETEQDYVRYGIERRSLADILTVNDRGLSLLRRSGPVTVATDGRPSGVKEKPKAERIVGHETLSGAPIPPRDMSREVRAEVSEDSKKDAEAAAPPPPPPAPRKSSPPRAAPAPQAAPAPPAAVSRARMRPPPPRRPAPQLDEEAAEEPMVDEDRHGEIAESRPMPAEQVQRPEPELPKGPPPLSGRLASIMSQVQQRATEQAVVAALEWRNQDPGDVMALIALGEALEARGHLELAARAYGSIIDLFPSRADMRRFAGNRLDRLGKLGAALAADSYAQAVSQRPDHLTGYRMVAYARLRAGDYAAAIKALEQGLSREFPSGRFQGGKQILSEDLGLVAAAWIRTEPKRRAELQQRLSKHNAQIASTPSLRFVLTWETDANDVDFHIYDGEHNHAYYSDKSLSTGGALYADVTNGYGPECFAIPKAPHAYPYRVFLHYYSRGPMGYGMGKLEIVYHDGRGNLDFEQRPFVVMNDGAYVDLGKIHKR